jgi:hypothetical protein
MSRRSIRTILAACFALSLVIVLLLVYAFHTRTVTSEEFLRAEAGWPEADVAKLFGSPGKPVRFQAMQGFPDRLEIVVDCPSHTFVKAELVNDPAHTWRVWPGEEFYIIVLFKDGVVVDRFGVAGPRRSILERVRKWIGW